MTDCARGAIIRVAGKRPKVTLKGKLKSTTVVAEFFNIAIRANLYFMVSKTKHNVTKVLITYVRVYDKHLDGLGL